MFLGPFLQGALSLSALYIATHFGQLRGMRFLPILALLVACSPSGQKLPFEPAGPKAAPNPFEFGPFPVGVRTVELLDGGRKKPDGTPRRVLTEVWYPAVEEARNLTKEFYDVRTLLTEEQRQATADVEVPILQTQAVRDADVSGLGPFPVILFSHGQSGIRWQSTYFTVLAASHGYVVVSPDHEGNTLADALRDGVSITTEGIESRPQDMSYLINWLTRLKPADSLYGNVDIEHIGMAGHSFGALTALRAAALDKRIDAIVPQTPVDTDIAWVGLPTPVQLGIPVMLQGSRLDKTLSWDEHVVPAWNSLSKPRYLLELVTGGHFSYSDLCSVDLARLAQAANIPQAADVENVLEDGCGPTAPPANIAQPLINHFAMAFFNAHLRGSTASLGLLTQEKAEALGTNVAKLTADP